MLVGGGVRAVWQQRLSSCRIYPHMDVLWQSSCHIAQARQHSYLGAPGGNALGPFRKPHHLRGLHDWMLAIDSGQRVD